MGRLEIDNNLTENAIRTQARWEKRTGCFGHPTGRMAQRGHLLHHVTLPPSWHRAMDYMRPMCSNACQHKHSELASMLPAPKLKTL